MTTIPILRAFWRFVFCRIEAHNLDFSRGVERDGTWVFPCRDCGAERARETNLVR